MKHYSFKEIVNSLPKKKNGRSSIWVRLLIRKISFPFTYAFINTGWSANMVSLLSWVVIFAGACLFCIPNFWCMLVGVVLTNFWLVLDCVDGNIARVKKQKSFMGDFYDAIAGYGPFAFTTIGLGMAAYHTSFLVTHIGEQYRFLFILIAAIGAISNIYTRLIHQKYLVCYFAAKKELGELNDITLKDTENKRSFAYIREQIDKNFGVAGLFMPWLFVALFTNTFDIMLIVYTIYYILSFLAVILIYCRRATYFEKESKKKLETNKEDK
ncbi:MAG: CDP-alcohol phosphatidyltransferase family protein [Clostridia bacterium]|nr:CDP-alcohol phosphatidyltransferase family protein [Clostridia bacterium]